MIILAILLIVFFGLIVFRGAPYVPTHKKTVQQALDVLGLKKGDLLVDLGSGDGVMLKAAAKRGVRVVGYELNPLLCIIAWLRCYKYRKLVTVKCRDFWFVRLPLETDAIFVFLAGPFMQSLSKKLKKEMQGRKKPLKVVSNGFAIPGLKTHKAQSNLLFYKLQP